MRGSSKLIHPNAAALFQKWMERDFIADTSFMHWQARLFYRALLQHAFLGTTRPDLPDDEDQLRCILGGVPESIWAKHRDQVTGMFQREEINGTKFLFHKRLRRDWKILGAFRKDQRDKANKRWKREQEKKSDWGN
jgi:uncharacterized protein YdaU (DUF1376 family)